VLLIEQLLAAGLGDGDGSRAPERAVLGPGSHVRRRDDPAGTRPAGSHHHAVLAMDGAGAPFGGARPRGQAGDDLTNEAGHLLLHCNSAIE